MSCPLRFAGTVVELVLPFLDALELAQLQNVDKYANSVVGAASSVWRWLCILCTRR